MKGAVELILVGNELLKGERMDAHLPFIGRLLLGVGACVTGSHVIGDDRAGIAEIVRDRLRDAAVLIVCGGLGPTQDDVTREGVADGLGLPLEFREDEWRNIKKIFASFGRKADPSNKRQAYFPKDAEAIANANGTAAGFIVESGERIVAVLPGPPRELVPMMQDAVLPRISRRFGGSPVFTETFRTTGIGESDMVTLITGVLDTYPEFTIASLPRVGGVDIVVTQESAHADSERLRFRADDLEKDLRRVLGARLYARGNHDLQDVVGNALAKAGATLAVAESLTGGLIGKRLTDSPGSSRYLLADVVAYSNEAKQTMLEVRKATIARTGAVSEEVCREMLHGIRERTASTYALATTGIAGPSGGSVAKPVGLCYYGLAWDRGDVVKRRTFPGDRDAVRERCTMATLFLLHEKLCAEAK